MTTTQPIPQSEVESVRLALAADYDLDREIGRGGMAVVYLAHERALGRDVAIKVLPSQFTFDEGFTERFQREARVSGSLEHPHIVPVYRVGRSGGTIYFVMQYLRGGSLGDLLLTRGALPAADVRRMLLETASALGYAARRGVVHRDVKSDNILLDEDGRCVVTDFGIARSASDARLTATGMTVGTPRYMSPEQARSRPLDGRSDLYSLGIVAYECLVGTTPFDGEDAIGILMAHLKSPVPQPALRTPEERALWPVIERMLAKEPEERFQSADEVIAALGGQRGIATGAGPAYALSPTRPTTAIIDPTVPTPMAGGAVAASAVAVDRALAAGAELLRRGRPKLDAGLETARAGLDAGMGVARAQLEAQRPAVHRGMDAGRRAVRVARARFAAGGRRSWIALGVAAVVAATSYYGLHFGIMHRSRCAVPATGAGSGDSGIASAAKPGSFALLLDSPARAGSDVEVYYDVCGLAASTPFTARLAVTRNESGIRKLFGGSFAPVTESFDETAAGPAVRRHRTVDLEGATPGSYTLALSVTDAAGRRRYRETVFRVQ